MSNVSILSSGSSDFLTWLNDFAGAGGIGLSNKSATSVTVTNGDGDALLVTGSDFNYDPWFGLPLSGNVTSVQLTRSEGDQVKFDNFSVGLLDLVKAAKDSGDAVVALFGDVTFTGSAAGDIARLGAGDDTLIGAGGNDSLDGGAGMDTAVFSGSEAAYTLAKAADGSLSVTSLGQTVTLKQIETLKFDDATVDAGSIGANTNAAPVISSNGGAASVALSVAENKQAAAKVMASDADNDTLVWTLGGRDAKSFNFDSKTGALTFKAAPDFEAPKDAGKNNVYDVTLKVSDGTASDTQALSVKVTNVKGVTRTGDAKANTLTGAGEEDRLSGKGGNDTLKGMGGQDTFVFDTALSTAKLKNVDKIADFNHADDTFELSNGAKVFAGLKEGHLAEAAFKLIANATSTKGVEKDDRILYDKAHGDLYFDQDGSGTKHGRVKFAEVTDKIFIDHTDFLVV